MKANNVLSSSQHGFWKGRSCTMALATAHEACVSASKLKVVAVISFDLSAAFDIVGRDLLTKMSAIGIGGKVLKWFRCYLSNAKQHVIWDKHVSDVSEAEYGVRQGLLLGPVLYLLHVFNLPISLEIRELEGDNAYANNTALWVIADDIGEAQLELQPLTDAMSNFTKYNGLALNRAKTRLIIHVAKDKDVLNFVVVVEGAEVRPGNTLELLGVTFDQKFTVRPYLAKLSMEVRFRARCVAQPAQHLPQGQLLLQLGSGLVMGKLAQCLPIIAQLRLPGLTKPIPEALESLQVAVNNVARTVVSFRREDQVTIKDLLDSARYLSVNQHVVKSTAMAALSAYVSNAGKAGTRNPVGRFLFDS
jgi:hypothetical protein